MTGLAAGIKSGLPVFEAQSVPGGICSSYYLEPGRRDRIAHADASEKAYRFEYGGGHWIFGGNEEILDFIGQYITIKKYSRSSAVYLPVQDRYVPYPLQYHLSYLSEQESAASLKELAAASIEGIETMEDWVRAQFGSTLNALFFAPFHELYTAGLWSHIRPQDNYKMPLDLNLVKQGAADKTPAVGYNATFVYPQEGLDGLALKMADACDVRYGKKIVGINTQDRALLFADGEEKRYDKLFSSLPLNEMVQMTGVADKSKADPHTAVLVMNIGAVKGQRCPDEHWIYVPNSDAGFHRIGFYSNVDSHFLPATPADDRERVSLYIERAFLPGEKPSAEEIKTYEAAVVRQLQSWGMIETAEAIDSTWIEVAYTWSWPDSNWIDESIDELRRHGIEMLGRYGRWHFQGIVASIREGLGINL